MRPEIDRVFKTGKRYSCKGMRIHVAVNELGIDRVVFVAIRSYPGAVQRNRARRVLRECWRLCGPERRSGFDVAVVLFPGYDEFTERDRQLRLLLLQAGILGGRS